MRLLSNIIRTGIISEVDEKSWCVRVRSGELETGWLRWNTTRAGAFNVWLPPSPGEQVVIACIGGNPETAMIIGSLWSDANPAPGKSLKEIVVSAPDGAVFRYDADAGALSASGMKTATLQASVSVTLDTPVVECTDLLRTATLDVTKGGKMSGNITHSGGNFTSNGITVHTHKHGGVKGGSDSTGGPQCNPLHRNEPGRNGKPERYGASETVSQGHPDHPAGKPGYATGIWQPCARFN
ncbi:phage baseplate assembly protein V [Escherichia coli]|nr:phage baseplate assembly protein V [Escherichia coli]